MSEFPQVAYDWHARWRMRRRGITEQQIEYVLAHYHTSYPAEPLGYTSRRAVVFVATVDGHDLKVYVEEGRYPPYVLTVVFRGEDQ